MLINYLNDFIKAMYLIGVVITIGFSSAAIAMLNSDRTHTAVWFRSPAPLVPMDLAMGLAVRHITPYSYPILLHTELSVRGSQGKSKGTVRIKQPVQVPERGYVTMKGECIDYLATDRAPTPGYYLGTRLIPLAPKKYVPYHQHFHGSDVDFSTEWTAQLYGRSEYFVIILAAQLFGSLTTLWFLIGDYGVRVLPSPAILNTDAQIGPGAGKQQRVPTTGSYPLPVFACAHPGKGRLTHAPNSLPCRASASPISTIALETLTATPTPTHFSTGRRRTT